MGKVPAPESSLATNNQDNGQFQLMIIHYYIILFNNYTIIANLHKFNISHWERVNRLKIGRVIYREALENQN